MSANMKNLRLIIQLLLLVVVVSCQDTIPNRFTVIPQSNSTEDTTEKDPSKELVQRPDGAVKFRSNFCGCKDGKPVTFGDCNSFCSNKNTNGKEILYVNFTLSDSITLNSSLSNLNGWCNTPLDDGIDANPKCLMEYRNESGTQSIDVTVTGNSSLSIDIDNFEFDKPYVLTLVESSSGSKSDSIQIIKLSTNMIIGPLGPLKNTPLSQYSCIYRVVDPQQPEATYVYAYRMHFYFHPANPPQPITSGPEFYCHDIFNPLYGIVDDILYPRLELIEGVFNIWDNMDPRFYDNNGNGVVDVNDQIIQKAKNFGATLPSNTQFFAPFPTLTPQTTSGSSSGTNNNQSGGNNSSSQPVGYYMNAWIDPITYKSFCLNSSHYNSNNPIYRALGDVLQVETEGVYAAQKVAESYPDPSTGSMVQAPNDYLFIKESDIKRAWFYMKDGVPTIPSDSIISTTAVFFYYPFNFNSPYVKSSTQRIYQVKGAQDLNNSQVQQGGSSPAGSKSQYPPHDRKFGCIPKF